MTTRMDRMRLLEYDIKQLETETSRAYTNVAFELLLLKGHTDTALKQMAAFQHEVNERLNHIDTQLALILATLREVKQCV